MKTIHYFFLMTVATFLMAANCSNKDSEFYNDVFVTAPNLVSIVTSDIPEDKSIYINATIPQLLNVTNQTNPLDVFKTTGGATKMNFSYELEKENTDGTWDYVELTSANLATTNGVSQAGSFVLGIAVYNSATTNYEYNVGIQALMTGSYRLSFGYNSNSGNLVEFRSESINTNLFLNLSSTASALDGGGFYHFEIN
jgi:hypothetical protein